MLWPELGGEIPALHLPLPCPPKYGSFHLAYALSAFKIGLHRVLFAGRHLTLLVAHSRGTLAADLWQLLKLLVSDWWALPAACSDA